MKRDLFWTPNLANDGQFCFEYVYKNLFWRKPKENELVWTIRKCCQMLPKGHTGSIEYMSMSICVCVEVWPFIHSSDSTWVRLFRFSFTFLPPRSFIRLKIRPKLFIICTNEIDI